MHQEVIENLESIQGALLRMNRSIQAEGTFGIMKNDRWYKRIVRRGIKSVLLDADLAEIYGYDTKGFNRQVKNNIEKFDEDFMFELTDEELEDLRYKNCTATH